jgi:hypothetical protein
VLKRAEPTSVAGVEDTSGATARAARCAVCAVQVPRYDHYCAWVDEPVGAANHRVRRSLSIPRPLGGPLAVCSLLAGHLLTQRPMDRPSPPQAYLAYVLCMLATCTVGGAQLLAAADVRWTRVWRHNESSLLLSFACYGLAAACAVGALLVHQLLLVLSGSTAYEARQRRRGGGDVSGHEGDASTPAVPPAPITCKGHVDAFLRQTAPLSAVAAAAFAGRAVSNVATKDPSL